MGLYPLSVGILSLNSLTLHISLFQTLCVFTLFVFAPSPSLLSAEFSISGFSSSTAATPPPYFLCLPIYLHNVDSSMTRPLSLSFHVKLKVIPTISSCDFHSTPKGLCAQLSRTCGGEHLNFCLYS